MIWLSSHCHNTSKPILSLLSFPLFAEQTLNNASGSIDGIAKTAADAGNTVVGHFTGTDGSF